ncbi:MAG: DNA replication/repair protein RecF [Anaerolineae bacterium]
MRLAHLSLTNFRNYTRLELGLPAALTVLQGANAQGKTNLLEAIHLLATGRSPRASAERELINWLALEGPLPYARLAGEIGPGRPTGFIEQLELVLSLTRNGMGNNGPTVRKQVRINGVAKRALDLIGRLRVVLFLPEDISLVAGSPAERRRYLDIALCQIDPVYRRALAEYARGLAQRNALLKRLRDEGGDVGQLNFWDDMLADNGSLLLQRRARAIVTLERLAAHCHRALTQGAERLQLAYLPSPDPLRLFPWRPTAAEAGEVYAESAPKEIAQRLAAQLHATRNRDIASGTSLLGPHRDDMGFRVAGRDLRLYGSRGQQRTAALALKLAEVQMMREETGENPLLLLDDVMSELDTVRRHALLEALEGVDQALVTTTDWSDFSPALLSRAQRLEVTAGQIVAVS